MVDQLFLIKKLTEVEFDKFLEVSLEYVETQSDYERIEKFYCTDEEGKIDKNLIKIPINNYCKEIYESNLYKYGTVRGAINAVLSKMRTDVYSNLSKQNIEEKISSGDYEKVSGFAIGSYDWTMKKNDGGTFTKQFIAFQTAQGELIELSMIGDKVGGRKYGKPLPYNKLVEIAYEPRRFIRANGKEDVDNAMIRILNVVDKEIDYEELYEVSKNKYTLEDIINSLENEDDEIKIGDWFWFEGYCKQSFAIKPFPLFEDGVQTGSFHDFTYVDSTNTLRYTFNLGARGKYIEDEEKGYYPTVRLQPVEIGNTNVKWSDDIIDLVKALNMNRDVTIEQVMETLSNNLIDRKFISLVKLIKIERREAPRQDDPSIMTERFFINLNAVYIQFMDEFYNYGIEETKAKETKTEETKKPIKTKEVKSSKKDEIKEKIIQWLNLVEDAKFEDLKENGVFDDYKDIPDTILKKISS